MKSETYGQSSIARPDLREIDPLNRWLARQNRLRLDDLEKLSLAEMEKVPAQQNFESVFAITLAEAQKQMRDTFKKAAPGQRRNTPPPSESIPKP